MERATRGRRARKTPFLAWDTVTSTTATAYATARALGLRAKIDQELKTNGYIWELYAATGVDAVPIRFAGSYQRDDTGETVAVEVVMRGRQKEIDTGEGKQGEDTESKISVVCTYFRLTMDGKELVEIDTINMIEKVNGVDRLEQHRRNIGL
ncbi:phage tail tube protein [Escherichia coli]|nr:phage tail tube protein [Escherichia coli]